MRALPGLQFRANAGQRSLLVLTLCPQAAQRAIEALGSAIPKPEFIPLIAGWEEFNKNGKALPDETVR